MLKTFHPIKSEFSPLPSLTTTHTNEGVQSRMLVDESKPPTYNNATIEEMRGNPLFDRVDQIDRKGMVERKLEEYVADYNKSDFRRAYYSQLQHQKKPLNNFKN